MTTETFRKLVISLIFVLLCGSCFDLSLAQNSGTDIVNDIQQAYANLKYDEAKRRAETALVSFQNLSPTELTEIHKLLGLIYYSQKKTAEAATHFETALSITPQIELDPIYVSPKIIDFFDQVKAGYLAKGEEQNAEETAPRYVFVYDPRPSAGMRSMLLPGWGQFYKGEKSKGLVLTTLWTVGVAGTIVTHLMRKSTEDAYLRETDPVEIERRFDKFDTYHKLRNNFVIFSAGVWLFSYFDAILHSAPKQPNLRLTPEISPDISRLNLSVSF